MKLGIRNFRSIKQADLDLAPITVLYGPNGAGKSSLIYALLTLRNMIINPNREMVTFFNYGFANLGDFAGVVFDHRMQEEIEVTIEIPHSKNKDEWVSYKLNLGVDSGLLGLSYNFHDKASHSFSLLLPVTFPYPANQQTEHTVRQDGAFVISWNGFLALVKPETPNDALLEESNRLAKTLNEVVETIRGIGVVPLKRGFTKPTFGLVPSPQPESEDEIANDLAKDKYLRGKVNHYVQQILDRDFQYNSSPGSPVFSLDTIDRNTGTSCELVNDGFGVNQIVFLLAKCLKADNKWVCIEEPEVHLHPTAIRNLALSLANITHAEGKRFIISTHSETFLLALLGLVARQELAPSELSCYLTTKTGRETHFEPQQVTKDGQISGGLSSFMAGELEDIAAFLGVQAK